LQQQEPIMPEQESRSRPSPPAVDRRKALCAAAGAAAGALMVSRGLGAEQARSEPQVLREGDRVVLDVSPEEIIEKEYRLGCDYEKKHGGCARCTVAALQDALPLVGLDEGLFRAFTCLDGGATPINQQNCGGFTGAGMVIGYVCGSRRNGSFHGSAKPAHRLLHEVYRRFAKEYGTVLCRDVRKGLDGNCPGVVGRAARWTAEVLLAEFAGYKPKAEPEDPAGQPEE
jgi:hypothetical protein